MKCRFSIMVAISAICSTRSVLRCDDLQKPIRTQAFILQGVRCVITCIAGIGRMAVGAQIGKVVFRRTH
jgi:hypothetical protein